MTYYLKDDEPIPGSDLAGYVGDKCDEVEMLRAENEMLRDQVRQMMNVPEFARNHMKDQVIAELLEALKDLMAMRSKCFIPNDDNWWDDKARAAIAKAEGE